LANFLTFSLAGVLIGLVTGIFSGFFGIGGGLISTPLIRTILGVSPLVAVGTPLPAIVPSAITAGFSYLRRNQINYDALRWCALAGFPAMLAGAYVTRFLSGDYLLIATAGLIFYSGARFVVSERKTSGGNGPTAPHSSSSDPRESRSAFSAGLKSKAGPASLDDKRRYLVIGLSAGFIGGLLGLGGGFLMIPLFVQWLKMPIRQAFGTSLLVVALISIPGSLVHFFLGHISVRVMALLILGILPGAYLGARLAFLTKEERLKRAFGILLMVSALYFAYAEFSKIITG
jgi:uncharacterized membrane protein YfcA